MKAIRIREHGAYEKLELVELPAPEPGPGEVRVRVAAAGLNHLDLWVRKGVAGHRFPLPLIPGSDAVGILDRAGGELPPGLAVGDRVLCLPGLSCGRCETCLSGTDQLCASYGILGEARDGCMAEFVVLPLANVHPLPEGLSRDEGAAFALTFLTAWNMLVVRAEVRAGETVLIHAAGSGVGSAAIQIAKLSGARVFATAGGADKCERARALGADETIDHREGEFFRKVKELSGGRGVDVVLDHVGADTFQGSLRSLVRGGRFVTCGATTGAAVELNLNQLFFKGLSLLGSTMGSKGDLLRILSLVVAGKLRPIVDRTLRGLESVREGHRLLADREVFGKVVIEIDPESQA